MAQDCFKIVGGKTVYFLNGRQVTEEEYRAFYPELEPANSKPRTIKNCRAWPLKSWAAGCAAKPSQRRMMEKRARELGVPTTFDEKGRAVFTDRSHRRAYLRATGQVDRSSFTGY